MYSSWSNWGSCDKTCNSKNSIGVKTRQRTINQQEMYGGKECNQEDFETQQCTSNPPCGML